MDSDKQKKVNYSVVFLVAAMLGIFAIQYLGTGPHVQQVPYSQFKALLSDGKVRDVVISTDQVQGLIQDEKGSAKAHAFTTVRRG